MDPRSGLTNQELMENGGTPFGNDGVKINLQHLLQEEPGPMVEIQGTVHQRGQRVLQGLIEDGNSFRNTPGLSNQYNKFRNSYWRWRATLEE